MKYAYLLISVIVLFSCKSDIEDVKVLDEKQKIYKRDKLQKILREDVVVSAEKGEFESNAILGHSMGMSRDTVVRFLGSLRKTGKLNLVTNAKGKRELSYVLRTRELGNLNVFFDAFYDDNKALYMLECRPVIVADKLVDYHDQISKSFTAKYGAPKYLYENEECIGKVWMDKTLVIEQFCQQGEVVIQYWDGLKLDYGTDEL